MSSMEKDLLLVTIDRNTRITKNIAIVFLVFLIIVVIFSIIAGILMLIYLPLYARNNNLIQTTGTHLAGQLTLNHPTHSSRSTETKTIFPINQNKKFQTNFLQGKTTDEKNSIQTIRINNQKNRNNRLNDNTRNKDLNDNEKNRFNDPQKELLNKETMKKENRVFQYKPLVFS